METIKGKEVSVLTVEVKEKNPTLIIERLSKLNERFAVAFTLPGT